MLLPFPSDISLHINMPLKINMFGFLLPLAALDIVLQ